MIQDLNPIHPLVLVDDEEHVLISFDTELRENGFNHIVSCADSREVIPLLAERKAAAVLLDLWMPHLSGEELLEHIASEYPETPVIVVTGIDQAETAVRCMKSGAFDYLVKPVESGLLAATVNRALKYRELSDEVESLKDRLLDDRLEHPEAFESILTRNGHFLALFRYVDAIAPGRQPVLITGETGVGKELFARAIHAAGDRSGPLLAVNAAGLDDAVFADTLFGHQKGAYTGADQTRIGLIEKAAGGTLFLDEIGDLSQASQLKLLRLVQEREYMPLGDDQVKKMRARLVAATNQNLEEQLESVRFRRDLYYRFRSHRIHVPPLREHLDDIPILVEHFLQMAAEEMNRKTPTPPPELFTLLGNYHYPGNVRELKAMVYDAVSQNRSNMLSLASFYKYIRPIESGGGRNIGQCLDKASTLFASCRQLPTLNQADELLVAEAMKRSNGNITQAAGLLGISRQALSKRLKKN